MKFNNVIDTLRLACGELSVHYSEAYQQQYGDSLCYFRYLVTDEIGAQLCTLMDMEFTDFEEFRDLVRGILSEYADPRLKNPSGEALRYIREAEKAFLDCQEALAPDCESPDIPYCRYLTGEEREKVTARFRETWNYMPHKYWYPLDGQEVREDRLFLHTDHVEDYWAQIDSLLGLPENHIFSLGECILPGLDCGEEAELVGYGGLETAYCPKDFGWIIYFSHEETVTFAGSILPKIREILEPEKEHWNRWE